jgi:hypothetical protein
MQTIQFSVSCMLALFPPFFCINCRKKWVDNVRLRKNRVVPARNCDFPADLSLIDVDVDVLKSFSRLVYETTNFFYAIRGDTVYRSLKAGARAEVVEAVGLTLDPAMIVVKLGFADLHKMATRVGAMLLHHGKAFYLVSSGVVFVAEHE